MESIPLMTSMRKQPFSAWKPFLSIYNIYIAALLKLLAIIQHFYKIYDSFYTDKKVELVAKTCEGNNVLKTLLSNILLQDSNLADFLLINITNEIIIEFLNYKDNVGFHGVTLRLGLYFAD